MKEIAFTFANKLSALGPTASPPDSYSAVEVHEEL